VVAQEGGGVFPTPLKRGARYAILVTLKALLGTYLASGFYVVGPDQRAVVRQFGAVAEQVGPGMHYRAPWPVDQVDVVKTTSVMKVGVGFVLPSGDLGVPSGMELLTGDTNILNAALVLQYVIRDPADFLFQIKDTSAVVEAVAEGVLTETVAGMPVGEHRRSLRVCSPTLDREVTVRSCRTVVGTRQKANRDAQRTDGARTEDGRGKCRAAYAKRQPGFQESLLITPSVPGGRISWVSFAAPMRDFLFRGKSRPPIRRP
jgi:SPFH domain / Band 7 family